MRRLLLAIGLVTAASAQVVYPPPTNTIQIVYGNNQTAQPETKFVWPMVVQVISPTGYPVSGVTVTFTMPNAATSTPGGLFNGSQALVPGVLTATAVTNVLGFAISPYFYADNPLGAFNATVSSAGLPSIKFQLATVNPYVPGPPTIAPNYLGFTMNIGAPAPPIQTLTVTTPANTFTATTDSPWVKLSPRGANFLDVSVDPTGMKVGLYDALIFFNGGQVAERVWFRILDVPKVYSAVPSLTFNYVQGDQVLPLIQPFSIGSSVTHFNFDVAELYVSPAKGDWLGVASKRGMTTPIQLLAVVDPRGLTAGTYTGTIQVIAPTINTPVNIPVTLIVTYVAPTLKPRISSFASAASLLDGPITAGELVNLTGSQLSCTSAPTVTVDGDAAQIVTASDSQIQVVIPGSVLGKDRVLVQVNCDGGLSEPFGVPVAYAVPAVFPSADAQVMAINEDRTANSLTNPASRGSVVTFYGTGFGALDTPDPVTGVANFLAPMAVTVAGEPTEVLSAVPVANQPGVVAVKIRVPWNINVSDPVAIDVQSGAMHNPAGLLLAVQM